MDPETVLVWDVLHAMRDQVDVVPLGGVYAFKYASLDFVFRTIVPRRRRREVFEQFLILRPYALRAYESKRGGREREKGHGGRPPSKRGRHSED